MDGQVTDSTMIKILETLTRLENRLPQSDEIRSIRDRLERLENSQNDMKIDLRAVRKQLLDPDSGIVVKVNRNTEFRVEQETAGKEFIKILDEHKDLMTFKSTITKILWILFTAIAGLVVGFLTKFGN